MVVKFNKADVLKKSDELGGRSGKGIIELMYWNGVYTLFFGNVEIMARKRISTINRFLANEGYKTRFEEI